MNRIVDTKSKFTIERDESGLGWSLYGELVGVTEDGEFLPTPVAALTQAFLLPDPDPEDVDLYDYADAVSGDAVLAVDTLLATIEANGDDCEVFLPSWLHLGTVEVEEPYRGQKLSLRLVGGLIDFIEGLSMGRFVITAICDETLASHWNGVGLVSWKRVRCEDSSIYYLTRVTGDLEGLSTPT